MNNLLRALPAGTGYFLGIVLITMCTGQLVHPQGSLARAALPDVGRLRWGWHRVERALERGQFSLDALFERAFTWCRHCQLQDLRLAPTCRGKNTIQTTIYGGFMIIERKS